MKINVLKLKAEGQLFSFYIHPVADEIRRLLGGPIDNIELFTDVQTFIRRLPNDLKENVFVPGVHGDIIITGGKGSYLDGLTTQQMLNLKNIFGRECVNDGKARL